MNMVLYDEAYVKNALSTCKVGGFFWEPRYRWHFVVQREHKYVECPGSQFSVLPAFVHDRLEIWPIMHGLQAIDFTRPFPQLLCLMHNGDCVWNLPLHRPSEPDVKTVSVDLQTFANKPVITIDAIPKELMEAIRRRWSEGTFRV